MTVVREGTAASSVDATQQPAAGQAESTQQLTAWQQSFASLKRDRVSMVALTVIVVVVLLAILAPVISPYDPYARTGERLEPVGAPGHIMGTDALGRDLLTRILWGGRVSLMAALVPVLLATLVATLIGILAGYSKAVGNVLMRVVDVFFAIPNVLLAVAIGAALGPGLMNVMIAIGIYLVPWISRIVYVEVVGIRNSSFVEAARVCGSSSWQIMIEEILPNAISPIIVASSLQMGGMITVAAGMSFLGLGVQPPTSDWGILVATGRDVLATAPQVAGIPGLLILIVAASFNLLGDGLRDALDPRLHTSKSQV